MPSRITDELCAILEKHEVNLINTHVNHPKEITPYFKSQMRKLAKTGVMLGNQSVLLKGVNDDPAILTELNMRLLECQIKPYYVYTTDNVKGTHHFVVPYERTIEIIEQMRGWNSGPSMPTFVLDAPGGGGKLPIQPEYVTVGQQGEVLWRNYEGMSGRATYLEKDV
jgi:lysine 2,3-aminomutase